VPRYVPGRALTGFLAKSAVLIFVLRVHSGTSECVAVVAQRGTHLENCFSLLLSQLDATVLWSARFTRGLVISSIASHFSGFGSKFGHDAAKIVLEGRKLPQRLKRSGFLSSFFY